MPHFLDAFKFWIQGLGLLLLGMTGFTVNTISISILSRKEMSSTCNHLLSFLAVSDNIHLSVTIVQSILTLMDYKVI